MAYLFGHTDLAAQRLGVLAEVFAESTRPFLRQVVRSKLALAVDLGCGPGLTTALLAATLPCEHVVGLDTSAHFISLAQQTRAPGLSFYVHDITSVPFPVGPCDLLYARFLLTHLKEPQRLLERWAGELRSTGLLLMEETEWIETTHPVFTTYLAMLERLLEHQANDLYVGRLLNTLLDTGTLQRRMSEVRRLEVAGDRAATMFFLNMQAWKDHPFIQTQYASSLIRELERDLDTLRQTPGSPAEIVWGIRQIAFERG